MATGKGMGVGVGVRVGMCMIEGMRMKHIQWEECYGNRYGYGCGYGCEYENEVYDMYLQKILVGRAL